MGLGTVYYGCMFSGKTRKLIAEKEGYEYWGAKVGLFKPMVDNRMPNAVACHNGTTVPAIAIEHPK